MALTRISGRGPLVPGIGMNVANSLGVASTGPCDATGEKIAASGIYWNPYGVAKSVERIGFRFGSITKAGGSGLTLSLQDVAAAAAPGQPDEVQDQTVAIANGSATFASNTWHRSGVLSATRSLTPGDWVSVVWEYDGSGRLGADTFNIFQLGPTSGPIQAGAHSYVMALKSGAWAVSLGAIYPNVIFEHTDGTFGCFEGSIIMSSNGTNAINSGTTPNEVGAKFVLSHEMLIDAIYATVLASSTAATFDLVLMNSAGTVLESGSFNPFRSWNVTQYHQAIWPFPARTLPAGTYYVTAKATSANNITLQYFDVFAAGHMACNAGPTPSHVTRTGTGSWTETVTRMPFNGFRLAGLHESGSLGGYVPTVPGSTGVYNF